MQAITFATPSRTLFAAPYWIAEHFGCLREENIDAALEVIGDIAELKGRLRSGQIQISIDTPDTIILDALSGGTLRAIAGNACKPPLYIMCRPQISSLADLRGATFGVLSLKEGSSKLIPRIIAAAGLSMRDVRVVEVGGAPARAVLLREGAIDVGLQPMPLNFQGLADGLGSLGWTGDYAPDWQFTTFNVDIRWAEANRALVERVLRALRKGMRLLSSEPEAADVIADRLSCSRAHAAMAIAESARLGILDPELCASPAGLDTVIANLRADGAIAPEQNVDSAQYLDLSFLSRLATC